MATPGAGGGRPLFMARSRRYAPDMLGWLKRLVGNDKAGGTLGQRGENLAARYLRGLGYRIVMRNYRCAAGEIDIIARDGEVLVFAEVKTRQEDEPMPEDQVNQRKRHQMTKAAKTYLSRYGTPQPPARFDVVAIVWADRQEPVVRHTQSAFEATF